MKVALVFVGSLMLLALFIFFFSRSEEPLARAQVVLTDAGFRPETIRIRKGGTITFSNDTSRPFWPASNIHPDHGLYPDFDPKRPLNPAETWAFTFDRVGDWGFHDHLRSYYSGVIHVVE